jgi:flagellin
VTATATSKGNVGNILVNPGVPTYVKTEGAGSVREIYDITFKPLLAGESVEINGLKFTATYNLSSTQVASAFASIAASTDATTVTNNKATNSALLGTYTGTFASGWATGVIDGSKVTATSASLTGDVTDIAISGNPQSATALQISSVTPVAASTVYGTVTLNSNTTFTVKPGANANPTNAPAADPTYANFTALGFEAKTINPKNIGRLSFQVGPAANQLISIDLADFGKNGDITGPITSDLAPTTLLTVNSANNVIMNVNKSLDRIAATRATMGAVMNRLEHVIDNLTNVVMNSEASRSQIEDADYAQASTELARTQIMQQAATAVLAQANTSQQTVLKLLQG